MGMKAPKMPDPFSPQAVAMRQEELEMQQTMAREEQSFQRERAQEDREWQEDLESKRGLRKQKEEEERIRALRAEMQESLGEEEAQQMAESQDPDEAFTSMWTSLVSGVAGNRSSQQSVQRPQTKKKSLGSMFSSFLSGSAS
jgi:hypothetical protein